MSVPLTVQVFDAFLGSQEGIHSVILPDIFSSGGSENLYIDKYGRAKRVLGYDNQNGSAVTTNGGGSATRLRSLFHYKQNSGGSTTRRLIGVFDDAVNEWELWYSDDAGATWTFLYDAGSGSINQIPDFAQFGDDLYITNGKVAPLQLSDLTLTTAGRTQSPTPTASASSSSGSLLGTYKYKLLSLVSGERQAGSATSASVSVTDKQISLSWTADANTSVTGYEVYRTSGTGDVFYFVDYVDGRTTVAYTDNTADLTILENRVLEEHGDAPPTSYFVEPHKQRMWYLRTDTHPTRGYFSDPADPESVYLGANFLDFSDAETVGDVITGGIGNYEGSIVVFTERAIWTVSGTGQVIGNIIDWTRTKTNAQTGCVHHRTAVRVPAGSKYTDQNGKVQVTQAVTLAYLTPLNDVRLFDGDNDVIISHPMKTTLSGLTYSARHKSHALHDGARGEISWFIPTEGAGEPSTAVTWNYRWGVWYERPLWGSMACAVNVDTSTQASLLLAGEASTTTGGYCYQLWTGNSANGAAFRSQWMTKTLYGVTEQAQPALSQTKRYRWADFLFETEQTVTLTVEWLNGNTPDNAASFGSTTISPAAAAVLTSDGDAILTADGDALVVSQASTNARALLKNSSGDYLNDTGMRLRVYDNAANGSWSLEAMNLAYQILPGLGRRMP
jgi:DNA-binding cell septation regulator SpoVG